MTYIVQGRVRGNSIRVTIGPTTRWTPDAARSQAKELLRLMDKASTRAMWQKKPPTKVTLRHVADAYLRDRPLKETTKHEIDRCVSVTLEVWQHKPIVSITRDMVTERFNKLKTEGLHGNRPAPAQANAAFGMLRALFNFAIREYRRPDGSPIIPDNPTDVLYKKWTPIKPRTSRIPENRVGSVWLHLIKAREAAYNRETLAGIDLIMFLLLTGARIGEASSLTWDRVNLEEAWWHIPDPKNSNPVWLPLSTQAVELLTTRQRVNGSPFVFTTWSKSGHITDPRDTMKQVSEISGLKLSPHDLRRTFTTIGVATLSIELHKIELLTNHVPRGVTSRHYLETSHLQYLRPEVQKIADWITGQARIAETQATGANVVPLRG